MSAIALLVAFSQESKILSRLKQNMQHQVSDWLTHGAHAYVSHGTTKYQLAAPANAGAPI